MFEYLPYLLDYGQLSTPPFETKKTFSLVEQVTRENLAAFFATMYSLSQGREAKLFIGYDWMQEKNGFLIAQTFEGIQGLGGITRLFLTEERRMLIDGFQRVGVHGNEKRLSRSVYTTSVYADQLFRNMDAHMKKYLETPDSEKRDNIRGLDKDVLKDMPSEELIKRFRAIQFYH